MFRKIQDYFRKKELNQTGVFLGEITEGKSRSRALICLLRGIVIFMGTFGTIIGLLEAFSLPYNPLIVIPFFLAISLYVAFLYYNKLFFYSGYFILLGGFTYELVRLYMYANSGYQAIINEIYLAYSDYFKLLSVREGQELVDDRYLTVTVAAIFLGVFMAMMLNVTISGYMNLFETVLVTLPLLEIAFFIDRKPPIPCICLVLAMYIFVGVLQASKHQRMQVKGKYTPEYTRFKRKNKKYYFYQGNAKGNLLTLIVALLVALFVGIFSYPTYTRDVQYVKRNPIRKQAEEYVKIFVQSGFTGLLDRYESTGGMNAGRLGGVGSVRPDFETDLVVTYAPYTYTTTYLKGYTGSLYTQNQWLGIAYKEDAILSGYPQYEETHNAGILTPTEIKKYDSLYMPESRATARMNVVNLDADTDYSYLPYHTDATQYANFALSPENSKALENGVDITYSPLLENYYHLPEDYKEIEEDEYRYYVNESCTYVPDSIKQTLEEYIEDHNFFDSGVHAFTEEENVGQFDDVNDYRLTMARRVYAHYVDEFKYTMSPGATPYRQDYITYFLTQQKRGYCAHFASAGVMLLRSMDIPARYVEGYSIPPSLLSENAVALDEAYDEWYEGERLIDQSGVINVEVNDSYAHAWIEIYMEGYGFVPFEMTIPSDDDETFDTGAFDDLFSGLFRVNFNIADLPEPGTASSSNNNGLADFFNLKFDFGKFLLPSAIAIGLLALGIIGFYTVRHLREKNRLKKLYANGSFNELVYMKYSSFVRCLQSSKDTRVSSDNPLPADVLAQLKRILSGRSPEYTDASLEEFFTYIEQTMYSPNQGSKEDYDRFVLKIDSMKRFLRKLKA